VLRFGRVSERTDRDVATVRSLLDPKEGAEEMFLAPYERSDRGWLAIQPALERELRPLTNRGGSFRNKVLQTLG